MSVAFIDRPALFQPVLSDGLYFTVSSNTYDAQTTFKFRYVYELYINGQAEFAAKCSPNPFGLGIIDLQQILETYTSSLPLSYFSGVPIYTHQTPVFSVPAGDDSLYFEIKVGYEYADSEISPITGFTGIGNSIGEPAFPSEGYKVFRSTMGTNGRATQQDFNTGPFILSGNPQGIYPTTSGLFLTNAPRIQDIRDDFYYTLSFTNYYTASGQTPTFLSEPYYVEYTFLDDQGQVISARTYDNIYQNGGGPRTNCNDVYPALYLINPWTGTTYDILNVAAGPANIPDFPEGVAQYTVQLFGKFTGSTSPIQPTPTPTPTPSATGLPPRPSPTPSSTPPCTNCRTYSVEYTGTNENAIATYTNCVSGAVLQVILYPGILYQFCSCTVPTGTDLDVVDLGPCVEVTPSPTTTPTPSPTPGCECSEYLLENESASTSFFQYIDCTGEAISDSLGAFQVTDICACDGTVEADDAIVVAYLGPCPTPLPTPSPTATPVPSATPTPTLTPGCFLTWNLNECGGTCSGGLCVCEGSTPRTVYTDCTVTSLTDPFTEIYENTALTNPFTGDFVSSGSIYNSTGSGVNLVCVIGGPC
jgi:hypothetical protein